MALYRPVLHCNESSETSLGEFLSLSLQMVGQMDFEDLLMIFKIIL
jgi:hypothetical protein